MKATYKIKKEGDNVFDTVIGKSNFTHDFSIREIKSNIDTMKKQKVALVSKAGLEDATCKNILRTNPEIADIDEKMLQVYYVYAQAKFFVDEVKNKVAEMDEAIATDKKALEEIIKQTGLKLDGE